MGIVGTARWHLHSLPVVAMMAATSQQRRRPVAAPMRDQRSEEIRDQQLPLNRLKKCAGIYFSGTGS
jgi:hypothetical protein